MVQPQSQSRSTSRIDYMKNFVLQDHQDSGKRAYAADTHIDVAADTEYVRHAEACLQARQPPLEIDPPRRGRPPTMKTTETSFAIIKCPPLNSKVEGLRIEHVILVTVDIDRTGKVKRRPTTTLRKLKGHVARVFAKDDVSSVVDAELEDFRAWCEHRHALVEKGVTLDSDGTLISTTDGPSRAEVEEDVRAELNADSSGRWMAIKWDDQGEDQSRTNTLLFMSPTNYHHEAFDKRHWRLFKKKIVKAQ